MKYLVVCALVAVMSSCASTLKGVASIDQQKENREPAQTGSFGRSVLLDKTFQNNSLIDLKNSFLCYRDGKVIDTSEGNAGSCLINSNGNSCVIIGDPQSLTPIVVDGKENFYNPADKAKIQTIPVGTIFKATKVEYGYARNEYSPTATVSVELQFKASFKQKHQTYKMKLTCTSGYEAERYSGDSENEKNVGTNVIENAMSFRSWKGN